MQNEKKISYFKLLLAALLLKALWAAGMLVWYNVALAPDEAQYWVWSQFLDWGYYSKPPGIAWQMWITSGLFGDTEFGVRIGAVFISSVFSVSLFCLARRCSLGERESFWAALIIAFSPMGFFSVFATTADGGLLLFWSFACGVIATALKRETIPNFFKLGLWIALAALFKWAAYILWVFVIAYSWKKRWPYKQVIKGFLVSFIGLLPSVYWNASHDWGTFRHHWAMIFERNVGEKIPLFQGNLGDFFASQVGVLSPVFFVILLIFVVSLFKKRQKIPEGVIFCAWVTLSILGAFTVFSVFRKIQVNWAFYAYPTASVIIAWQLFNLSKVRFWARSGLVLSLVLVAITLSIPVLQANSWEVLGFKPSFKINPFRQSIGWEKLPLALEDADFDAEQDFLFSERYQWCSILSFYSPSQKRAYFFNVSEAHENQFSFWPSISEEKGKTGYLLSVVTGDNTLKEALAQGKLLKEKLNPFFEKVSVAGTPELFSCYGKVVKRGVLMRCEGYSGKMPVVYEKAY
jgi:hypothetical protein